MKRQRGNDLNVAGGRRNARVVADMVDATLAYEQITGGRWQTLAEQLQREAGEDTDPLGWRTPSLVD